MVCAGDLAGQLRGKAVPRRNLEARRDTGIGWTPTNVFITSFGPIAPSPWGALGDLLIRPDFAALVDLDLADWGVRESFVLGDILELDGTHWSCCPRGQLKAAAARLEERHGLTIQAAFEHEFHYSGAEAQPGLGYALRALRRMGDFPDRLMAVLDRAGLTLDTFMPEYGPGQCEVTVGHQPALRAADEASILRELVRATARGLGARASFAPILDPDGVGNGVHVHFSLLDSNGEPVNHDGAQPFGVSRTAGAFLAGVLRHLPDFLALTAPAVVSYLRLTPNRWSAAYTNLGNQDREAALRICPVFGPREDSHVARAFHFEFRAADAAATPHLVLAALINAGIAGLDADLPTPTVTEADLSTLDPAQVADLGCQRLPQSLAEALDRLAASDWARAAFGETLVDTFLRHKRTEIEVMEGLSEAEMCGVYGRGY
ncbi:MAG: glutamine synthetase [Hyphomicrobiales bacterium]|nr:glutamine synthetase [Hyphomicrobiales bacterium]